MGRADAAPLLLKVFDLLPADIHSAPEPFTDAILVSRADQLPPALQRFTRDATDALDEPRETRIKPPIIDFPVNGTVVSLAGADKRDTSIALKAEGGRAPFTWLINGAVLGSFDRYQETGLVPDGEGFARITVVDADGRSATSRVRFKKPERACLTLPGLSNVPIVRLQPCSAALHRSPPSTHKRS